MKNKFAMLLAGLLTLFMGACSSGIGGVDTVGIFYSDLSHSESRDTSIGMRKGQSCQVSYLGLIAMGDNSIPEAARNGAIREVYNVSYRQQSLLFFLWRTNCTVVYGK